MSEATTVGRQEFRSAFESILAATAAGVVRDHAFFDIASDRAPWLDSGIDLEPGDSLSSFAVGATTLKGTPITLDPYFQLWFRIGPDGEIFRGTRDAHSFTAERGGRLFLASYFPGEWSTRTGDLRTPAEAYDAATGGLSVLLIRWNAELLDGLNQLADQGDVNGLVATEVDRLSSPVRPPEGWDYLWFMGPAEIYTACSAAGRESAICCRTHKDGGILQKNVSLPLKPDTRLRWSWKMDTLPSTVREDNFPTHDYMSIAVEFDNGQDITYYWSAELPVGTAYRCPIPTWTARETHVVVRSGEKGLGEWFDEERDVYQDYANAIGGPMPGNIVRVWLIAVSLFQRAEGRSQYADIALIADGEQIPIR